MNHENDRPRHPLLRSLRNVTAIFLSVILLSSAMIAWGNSETAHDLKFRIEKFFQETGDQPNSAEAEGSDDNVISMKITDPEELKTIKRQIPELLVPEKLPEGYAFSSAEVDKWKNGNWLVRIYYSPLEEKGKVITVDEENNRDELDIGLKIKAEEIELNYGKIYYIEENDYTRGVYCIINNISVQISGSLERRVLLQMVEGLQ